MAVQDSYGCLVVKNVKTDTAATDAYVLQIPFTGSGYAIRRITAYRSRLLTTGATATNATTTIGVFGSAGGAGVTIVANAATATLTGNTIVADLTIAATALTPIVNGQYIYFRVGTASGVASSGLDFVVEYSLLP